MQTEQLFDALERHLKTQSEPELLLLKGHLILEQCLNELLRVYIADTGALEKLNLSFSRKLDLLVALGHKLYVPGADGEPIIREINRIRNKLAHRLEFEDYQAELKNWACSALGYTPKTINRRITYINTIRRAFTYTAAFMSGVAEAKHALKSRDA
jgi:hypothetical protein